MFTVLEAFFFFSFSGKGSFSYVGQVISKEHATDRKALKIIIKNKINENELPVLKRSYDVLNSIKHCYIVRLRERCENDLGM